MVLTSNTSELSTMCVFLTVNLSSEDASRIDEIAAASSLTGPMTVSPIRGLFQKRTTVLHIFEPRQGCSCSFISDNEYHDDGAWALRIEILRPLASALSELRNQTREGFSVDLNWIGDKTTAEERVDIAEMAHIIHENRVRPEIQYVVR